MNTIRRNLSRASSITFYIGIFITLISIFGIVYQVFFMFYFVSIAIFLGLPILITFGLILLNSDFSNFANGLLNIDSSSIEIVSTTLRTYSLPLFITSLSLFILTIILSINSPKNYSRTVKFVLSSILIVVALLVFILTYNSSIEVAS